MKVRWECPICGLRFKRRRLLALHLCTWHSDGPGFYCEACAMWYGPDGLDWHLKQLGAVANGIVAHFLKGALGLASEDMK